MQKELELRGETKSFLITRREEAHLVTLGDSTYKADLRQVRGAEHILTLNDKSTRVWLASNGDNLFVHHQGQTHRVTLTDPLTRAASENAEGGNVSAAPMPGTVVSVAVAPGDKVAKGASLMVIESMKLQTTICAWRDGVVDQIRLKEGDTFDRGAALISLEGQEA